MNRRLILTGLLIASLTTFSHAADANDLRLVPWPKELSLQYHSLTHEGLYTIQADPALLSVIDETLLPELKRANIKLLNKPGAGKTPCSLLMQNGYSSQYPAAVAKLPDNPKPESYALTVTRMGIALTGADRAGALHGLATLAQLFRANETIPCLTIHDWPTLRYRVFQDDLTRGPSSLLTELQNEVRLGAALKMNVFTYYMEYQYAFSKHPLIGPKDGSLQPSDLKELVAYGKPRGVDIMGNQQSFGHLASVMRQKPYSELREVGDTISPAKEGTYALLDDLYSEVIPLLPFPFFNVCCDETADLDKGPSRAMAEQLGGAGAVYATHVQRLHKLVSGKYGKRMMMWGDIILRHPDRLEMIPRDTIMLTWGYEAAPTFEPQIIPFKKSGYEFFVCPGVNCWNRILPDFDKAVRNIQVFTREGVKHGCLGMLNTAWDDDGENLNAPSWHGLAWGAECAWNGGATSIEDFNRRIGAVLFGEKGNHFGQAIALLAKLPSTPGMGNMMNARFWNLDLDNGAPSAAERRAQADAILAIVKPAIEHLKATQEDATTNASLLDAFIVGAKRIELIADRIVQQQAAAGLYLEATQNAGKRTAHLRQAKEIIQSLAHRHAALAQEWTILWNRENHPYALDRVLKRYADVGTTYTGMVERLETAERTPEGKPLPPLAEMGMGLAAAPPVTGSP